MDPLNPIVPSQSLIGRIPTTPGVPRVGPDQQRQQARDDGQGEQDADDDAAFEDVFAEAGSEPPSGLGAIVDLTDSDDFFIPEVSRSRQPVTEELPAEDRRSEGDDDEPGSHHIDISA